MPLIIIYILAGFLITFLAGLLYLFLRQKTPSNIHSYGDIRAELIHQAKESWSLSPATHRPSNLDTRIDSAVSLKMRSFENSPPTNAQQRVELFRLFTQVIDSIYEELDAIGGDGLPVDLIADPRRVVFTVYRFESEINNGGLDPWYLNTASTASSPP